MSRTDTIEYFQNVASEIQSAEAKDIAREALTVIGGLLREAACRDDIKRLAWCRKLLDEICREPMPDSVWNKMNTDEIIVAARCNETMMRKTINRRYKYPVPFVENLKEEIATLQRQVDDLQREVAYACRDDEVKAKDDSDWDGVSIGHDDCTNYMDIAGTPTDNS